MCCQLLLWVTYLDVSNYRFPVHSYFCLICASVSSSYAILPLKFMPFVCSNYDHCVVGVRGTVGVNMILRSSVVLTTVLHIQVKSLCVSALWLPTTLMLTPKTRERMMLTALFVLKLLIKPVAAPPQQRPRTTKERDRMTTPPQQRPRTTSRAESYADSTNVPDVPTTSGTFVESPFQNHAYRYTHWRPLIIILLFNATVMSVVADLIHRRRRI